MIFDGFHVYHFIILGISLLFCSFGFILFSRNCLYDDGKAVSKDIKVSVIIPARNEEKNLPFLLASLANQSFSPYEIIVIDDFSVDKTAEIARGFKNVTLLSNPELPGGWTGKNWAVWNGYLHSTGNLFVFLDSDIRLAPNGLELIINNRMANGGVISVLPFHYTEKFYERFSLVLYILGFFAFTAPKERSRNDRSLYGSCIAVTREDYEKVSGHEGVKSELLDDMSLGKSFSRAGIKVQTFCGCENVSFRMYPDGIKSEFQGFSKGAVAGAATLCGQTVFMISCWLVGVIVCGIGLPIMIATLNIPLIITFAIGSLFYTAQFYYFSAFTGRYGVIIPVLHAISSLFFIAVMLYSSYRSVFFNNVLWKGRFVAVSKKIKSKLK